MRALPSARSGLWFAFADGAGHGHCSPDLVLQSPWGVVVLEAKLTDCPEAYTQISQLYRPILEAAFNQPVLGVVVCKNIRKKPVLLCETLAEALRYARLGHTPTLHWLGKVPSFLLLPFPPQSFPSGLAPVRQTG